MIKFSSALFIPAIFVLSSCQKQDITSIWVNKESAPVGHQQGTPPHPRSAQSASTQNDVLWTKPTSWVEAPASNMRVASFSFKGKNGTSADISVVRLAGDGGGLLANINRWRGQLQMEPTTLSEMEKSLDQLNVDGHPMLVTHLKNKGSAMLAGIYTLETESWYVKMTGDEKTLNEARPSFYEFIRSIRHPH